MAWQKAYEKPKRTYPTIKYTRVYILNYKICLGSRIVFFWPIYSIKPKHIGPHYVNPHYARTCCILQCTCNICYIKFEFILYLSFFTETEDEIAAPLYLNENHLNNRVARSIDPYSYYWNDLKRGDPSHLLRFAKRSGGKITSSPFKLVKKIWCFGLFCF